MNDLHEKLLALARTLEGQRKCVAFSCDCGSHALQGLARYPKDPEIEQSLTGFRLHPDWPVDKLFANCAFYAAEYAAAYAEKTRKSGQDEREWQRAHLMELMESAT